MKIKIHQVSKQKSSILKLNQNLSIALMRAIIEISAVIVGWYLGGVVGIGTVVFALGIGPFVSAGLFFVGRYIK